MKKYILPTILTGIIIYQGVKLYKGFNKYLNFDSDFDLTENKDKQKLEKILDIDWESVSG